MRELLDRKYQKFYGVSVRPGEETMSERQLRAKEALERLRAGIHSGDFAADPDEDLREIEAAVLEAEEE